MTLDQYKQKFRTLRVDTSHKEPAPHKPILLLAIMELIKQGKITDNRVYITGELVSTFLNIWNELVTTGRSGERFFLPFFHLQSSSFWKLHALPGMEQELSTKKTLASFKQLITLVHYGELDEPLLLYMSNNKHRQELRDVLLQTFFNPQQVNIIDRYKEEALLTTLEEKLLRDPAPQYQKKIKITVEEKYARSGLFKSAIPKLYDFTCSISGLKIDPVEHSILDACHITPFAKATPSTIESIDTITNGIALCPNLHRALDKHLITISDDYRVIIKKQFTEDSGSYYGILQFENKQLNLPRDQRFWPSKDNLKWHREWAG